MNKRSAFLIASLLLGVFCFNLVSAATLGDSLSKIPVLSTIVDSFGSDSIGLALILFVALVVLAIYSVTSFIPILGDSEGIKWAFSIIVGILCFFYVKMETIRTILVTYESLGIVLTSVIPFLVIFAFTIKIETGSTKNYLFSNILANISIWVFIGYLLIKISNLYSEGSADNNLVFIYWITLIVAVIWAITKSRIIAKANKSAANKSIESITNRINVSNARDKANEAAAKDITVK